MCSQGEWAIIHHSIHIRRYSPYAVRASPHCDIGYRASLMMDAAAAATVSDNHWYSV